MTGALDGMTAFITGGSGGIGKAAALRLAQDGAALMLMARRVEGLEAARAEILAAVPDARIEITAGDARSETEVIAAMDRAVAMQGRLDFVVPTVGGSQGYKPILMMTPDDLRHEFESHIVSAFLAIKHAAPRMTQGGGIVCISATSARMPLAWMSAAGVAKSGLEALMRTAAEELAEANIRVNAVRPGLTPSTPERMSEAVRTAFTPLIPLAQVQGRVGRSQDVAEAIRYLAGPESSFVTGQSFAVDGGQELRRNPDMYDQLARTHGDAAMAAIRKGKLPPVTADLARDFDNDFPAKEPTA